MSAGNQASLWLATHEGSCSAVTCVCVRRPNRLSNRCWGRGIMRSWHKSPWRRVSPHDSDH